MDFPLILVWLFVLIFNLYLIILQEKQKNLENFIGLFSTKHLSDWTLG